MRRIFLLIASFGCLLTTGQTTIYTSLKEVDKPDQVKHLELRKDRLESFPEEIFAMTQLEILDLGKNRIKRIPERISELKNLKVIILSRNEITDLSPLTSNFALEEIHADRNPIQSVPKDLNKLDKLLVFDCWQCELESLPKEMKTMQSLIEIDLRQTFIRQQDAGIYYEWWPNAQVHTTWGCNCGK